jgi:protein ImuB
LDLEAHPPQDAIVAVVLQVEPGTTSDIQLGIFSPQMPDPARLDVTLARIRALVGDNNVGHAVLKDTHEPDSVRLEPFTISCSKPETFISSQERGAVRRVRPSETISVTLHNASPALFVFREHQYKVERAYGPWLAEGDWWNQSLWGYEQWDLIARARDGSLLCCCIERDLMQQQWQLVSLYD